jgi:2-(1,2-epoxy-1,2-dihydrophenyl)acetyl-CoA isomerase
MFSVEYETINFEAAKGIATITLNRPASLNAFNDTMIAETTTAFKQTDRDKTVRCVVITGNGRAFSSGQDLKDVQSREATFYIGEHLRQGYNKLITQMVAVEKPVVAAVNGVAAGAGCGVALAADLRIASDQASFIQAFSRVGLVPDSGSTWTLPRLIGYARAYQMAITGERITASKALDWGLVNDVVPHDQLQDVVAAWTSTLATGPTLALGLTKRAMHRSATTSLIEALEYESMLQEVAGRSHDSREGIQAFVDKREAHFTGE